MTRRTTPQTIELFSGAGLLSEGFRRAGFKAIYAAEADERAVASFNRNVAPVAEQWDVTKPKTGLKASCLVGGPPCQGYSSLGKRDANDDRNRLSLSLVDWALATDCQVIVIENVPQFLDSTHWKTIRSRLKRAGFESTEWLLNAADFGVPQLRVRAFGILSRIGLPVQPQPKVRRHMTVGEAFAGLPKKPASDGMHVAPIPSEIASRRFSLIPAGGDKRDILRLAPELCPPSWFKVQSEATDVWGRMDLARPSNTLRCAFQNASKGRYVHPTEDRVISLREGARLQGVPDDWEFIGDRASIARQIGNGVPIPLAHAVASSVRTLFN